MARNFWDSSRKSWVYYRIRSQPAAVLLNAGGQEIGRWNGYVDLDEALKKATAAP